MTSSDENRWRAMAASPVDDQIDALCDAFEQAWVAGDKPPLQSYLERGTATSHSTLFQELLAIELDYRRRRGETPDRASYLEQYAEYSEKVETAFAKLGSHAETLIAPLRLEPGEHIGRFELLERIGTGGCGEVWKAFDPQLKRYVALKTPLKSNSSERELARFYREGQAAAQLRHPQIVAVHEAWRDTGSAYLVCDFLEGGDLRTRLRQRNMSQTEAVELMATIANALQYAHSCGIVHRDLKPANILLDAQGSPHIGDFGLAKWTGDAAAMTIEGDVMGTVSYMSPEQARGETATLDARSDIYSLGAMLYELLAHRPPFVGSAASVLHRIVATEPTPLRRRDRRIPRDLETICAKALAAIPDDRYATAGEFAADLRHFLRGDPIAARPPSVARRAWRAIRRHPFFSAFSVAVIVVALNARAVVSELQEKNRRLLGLQTAVITTEPPGARIVVVPLDAETNEPVPADLVEAPTRSPVTLDLRPGAYFVVAALDDGRFHEVLRNVPATGSQAISVLDEIQRSTDGKVLLRCIDIPPLNVTEEMVRVDLAAGKSTLRLRRRGVSPDAAIFVDKHEYDAPEFSQAERQRKGMSPHGFVTSVAWPAAVVIAEHAGKRLPWGFEVDLLVARLENAVPASQSNPSQDSRLSNSLLAGLRSSPVEWTSSGPQGVDRFEAVINGRQSDVGTLPLRIVKGDLSDRSSPESPAPRAPTALMRASERHDQVGFRCYRSAKPHLTPADFGVDVVRQNE